MEQRTPRTSGWKSPPVSGSTTLTPLSELAPKFEIAVFAKGTRTSGLPQTRISREDAQWMIDCGTAHWVNNRHKSIQMDAEAVQLKIRDQSAQMGPIVTILAAQGSHYHQALCNAWA